MTSFDVVVVGSGPGGAAAARELAHAGARVLVLERGRVDPPTGQADRRCASCSCPAGACSGPAR